MDGAKIFSLIFLLSDLTTSSHVHVIMLVVIYISFCMDVFIYSTHQLFYFKKNQ